jgi:hypothetical protein
VKGEETCTYIATSTGWGRVPLHMQQAFQEVQHLFPVAIAPCEKRQACTRREVLKHGVRLSRVVSCCLCDGLGLARRDTAGRLKHGRARFQSRQIHGSQSPIENLLQDKRRQGFNTALHYSRLWLSQLLQNCCRNQRSHFTLNYIVGLVLVTELELPYMRR